MRENLLGESPAQAWPQEVRPWFRPRAALRRHPRGAGPPAERPREPGGSARGGSGFHTKLGRSIAPFSSRLSPS